MNFVDAYYKTMDTRVVVTNLIIWNEENKVPITDSAQKTLEGKYFEVGGGFGGQDYFKSILLK